MKLFRTTFILYIVRNTREKDIFGMAESLKQCYAAYGQAIRKPPDTAFNSVGSRHIYIAFLIITFAVTDIFDFRYVKREVEDNLTE